MENSQSSYYSGSYGDTAVKISHYTVHQKVSEQHISQLEDRSQKKDNVFA